MLSLSLSLSLSLFLSLSFSLSLSLSIYIYIYIYIYCGEWNSLYSDLKPKKLLGHKKVVGPGLCAEGKAQREIIHERVESWIV